MTLRTWSIAALVAAAAGCLQFARPGASGGSVALEFRIEQDMDIVLFSDFGEPAQFAIWLENPVTHATKTVFVTRRSATGDWVGKAECPASLPRWFNVWRQETGHTGLPRADAPAADGVSGPTPKTKEFTWTAKVTLDSEWVCWIEVNIAADFRLIPLDDVIDLIRNKPASLDLILTGRYAPPEIIAIADTVSEIKEVRHHYHAGVKERAGIEF